MYIHFKATYDSNHDTFRVEFLVVPVGGLAFLVNHEFSPLEVSIRAVTCDLLQCGILTSVDSDQPVQPPFKRRSSK